jgi:hypothetical protein
MEILLVIVFGIGFLILTFYIEKWRKRHEPKNTARKKKSIFRR